MFHHHSQFDENDYFDGEPEPTLEDAGFSVGYVDGLTLPAYLERALRNREQAHGLDCVCTTCAACRFAADWCESVTSDIQLHLPVELAVSPRLTRGCFCLEPSCTGTSAATCDSCADARHVLNETLGETQHDLDSADDNRQERSRLLAWRTIVLAVLDLI
ncbi:MAG TPA: hypothetical protein VFU07_05650 [Candidatus Lumbricidophila sp.]|nr:hypothetical protein [Candidatus Lumbricidophila sp.]